MITVDIPAFALNLKTIGLVILGLYILGALLAPLLVDLVYYGKPRKPTFKSLKYVYVGNGFSTWLLLPLIPIYIVNYLIQHAWLDKKQKRCTHENKHIFEYTSRTENLCTTCKKRWTEGKP